MKKVICYPVSISWELYKALNKKYQNIGWIYNPYGDCWTHYFHKESEKIRFIRYVKKELDNVR